MDNLWLARPLWPDRPGRHEDRFGVDCSELRHFCSPDTSYLLDRPDRAVHHSCSCRSELSPLSSVLEGKGHLARIEKKPCLGFGDEKPRDPRQFRPFDRPFITRKDGGNLYTISEEFLLPGQLRLTCRLVGRICS